MLKKQKIKYEVILAEDGSSDRTKEILNSLKKKYHFLLLEDSKRLGYVKAAKILIKKAKGNIIFFLDSDGEVSPESFWKLYKIMKSGKYDLINGLKLKRKPFYRFFISCINNIILNILFATGVQDANSGCKMYKKNIMIPIIEKCILKYDFNAEQLIRAKEAGFKIKEVGVKHFERTSVAFEPRKLIYIVFLAFIDLVSFRIKFKREVH